MGLKDAPLRSLYPEEPGKPAPVRAHLVPANSALAVHSWLESKWIYHRVEFDLRSAAHHQSGMRSQHPPIRDLPAVHREPRS